MSHLDTEGAIWSLDETRGERAVEGYLVCMTKRLYFDDLG